jgi:magnesium transporter
VTHGNTAAIPLRGRTSSDPAAHDPEDRAQRNGESVMGDCALYVEGVRQPGTVPLDRGGDVARTTEGFVWIGLRQPSDADIAQVAEEFHLPALAVEDAVTAHQRPKLEVYGDVVFVVLKPVRYVDYDEVVDVAEIAMFLGPHFAVTVRHGDSDVLRRIREELESPAGHEPDFGAATVLYRAADLVVDGYEQAIEHIQSDFDEIEARVFGTAEDDHAERIYTLKQEVAQFRRALVPLARPLENLAAGAVELIDAESAPYFRDVHDHLLRASDALEAIDRQLSDVLQANTARVTTTQSKIALRQNEDMRKISSWAAIALVPTAIAGIYGMNFDSMPELRWKYGYFLVLAVIATVCGGLHRLFRRNGWL